MEGFFVTFLFLIVTSFASDASAEGKPSDTETLVTSFVVFVLRCLDRN